MKSIALILALAATVTMAFAQEKLSRDDALTVAKAVSTDPARLNATPLPTDVDLNEPVVVVADVYGGMVLPQKGLKPATVSEAGTKPVAIGQLWLRRLTPVHRGEPVPTHRLKMVKVSLEGEELSVPQCTLGVQKSASGKLELVVLGSGPEPIATVPLTTLGTKTQSPAPIDLDGERDGEAGIIKLKILGQYEAELAVTDLES